MALPPFGVVLAAGGSTRLGQPKPLVEVDGRSLVSIAVDQLNQSGCHPVYVVTRFDLSMTLMAEAQSALIVVNQRPELGRTRSLQLALKAAYSERGRWPRHAVVAPVDRPGWRPDIVHRLLECPSSAAPQHQGRGGHPVTLDQEAMKAVVGAPSDAPLKDIVRFERVQVHAPWLHLNIDTPEDLEHLVKNATALMEYLAE